VANLDEQRNRLTKLFTYLKSYIDQRFPPVRDIKEQFRVLWLDSLPAYHTVQIYRDGDSATEEEVLMRVRRPELTGCPVPPPPLIPWLKPSWREFPGQVELLESRNVTEEGVTEIVKFGDDPALATLLDQWTLKRERWISNERPARLAMQLFETIYEWHGCLSRDGSKIELLLGDGMLSLKNETESSLHPILLQKLDLDFNPEEEQPEFIIRKREVPPELYLEFLRTLPGVNVEQVKACADELQKAEFSPLGADGTDGFLRRLIQGLFPSRGEFVEAGADEAEIPTIKRQPVLFLRQRRASQSNIFDLVLADIPRREEFPLALLQILGVAGEAPKPDESTEVITSMLGNEDEEILLSKPANKEQLKIAKQLARGNCVLVQGPPGTGKTHTIANLLGHLLAQGKRVLVTAHTPKALRVLRSKVVQALQPLCISVLQNDKRSQEDLQESVKTIHLKLSGDVRALEDEANRIRQERTRILKDLRKTREKLVDALQDETRDIVFAGTAIRPMDAARKVKANASRDGWIPSPVTLGSAMPLSHAEVVLLYQTNATVSKEDERELKCFRPSLESLPTPGEFTQRVDELKSLLASNLKFREELWDPSISPEDLTEFDQMVDVMTATIEFMRQSAPWQMEAVQSGRDGEVASKTWESLAQKIESTWNEIQECHAQVMEYGPVVNDPRPPAQVIPLLDEIIRHHEAGGGFGFLTKMTKGRWYEFQKKAQIGSRELSLESLPELQATRGLLRITQLRSELLERWERQMSTKGAPQTDEMGETPENVAKQFVPIIRSCVDWNNSSWVPLEQQMTALGFLWNDYLNSTTPEVGANAELNRIRNAITGDLGAILQSRRGWLHAQRTMQVLAKWCDSVPTSDLPDAKATQNLRSALRDSAAVEYRKTCEELGRLANLEGDLKTRQELLVKMEHAAPAWASAIQGRVSTHSAPEPGGDPSAAWEWRQLQDELERRASVSLDHLQNRIEADTSRLLTLTAELCEGEAWRQQILKVKDAQKQALGAYAALRNRLTKTGKGVRDAEIRAASRREMLLARNAVPVWIMPLAEVAETFDPSKTRFDCVIIDEASQCDPSALYALYLGDQTIVVGDDEQVTPVAVGVDVSEVQKLISVYLAGLDHPELYDGETSIYELAQIAFGQVIRLTEHFRCAPNIIAFSNHLSYHGEIKPLREATSIKLTPHVIAHRVEGGLDRGDNVNEIEAETIASLICASIEQPEYARNELGESMSFGVVSLVADKQALKIDSILRQRLEPAEYLRRQILCGDAAQFQGDERDVMFISLVDCPPENPPLPLRQEGPKKIFKKRYNVAASRARNQMWVVHSLNHETDLKPQDYRRRIIEHAVDPQAWERELQQRLTQVDPNSKEFEGGVLRALLEKGFNVLPQYQVGAYRIDLVVVGSSERLAVECDGEAFHGPDKLQEDMDRQAVLERLGWKFVRIRGSLYFRDAERALEPVLKRLEELNIQPELKTNTAVDPSIDREVVDRIIRRAQEIRGLWAETPVATAPAPRRGKGARQTSLNLS
jgi:very-short-patch-repair endonuclease/uncharacterized protein YoxC